MTSSPSCRNESCITTTFLHFASWIRLLISRMAVNVTFARGNKTVSTVVCSTAGTTERNATQLRHIVDRNVYPIKLLCDGNPLKRHYLSCGAMDSLEHSLRE